MIGRIDAALQLARQSPDYAAFREAVYADPDRFFCQITCDSRETVPLTLALFLLAGGEVEKCVTYAANLGRDADTIASMAGAIAGALHGVEGIKGEWAAKVRQLSSVSQEDLAARLVQSALEKQRREQAAWRLFDSIV